MSADKHCNGYILRKHYTTSRPASRVSREMDARILTNNVEIISMRCRGDSGKWSLLGDKASRGSPTDLGGAIKRGSHLKKKYCRYTKIHERSTGVLNAVLTLKDRKRLAKKHHAKGGLPRRRKLKKYDNDQRNGQGGAEN